MSYRQWIIAFALIVFTLPTCLTADQRGAAQPSTRPEVYGQGVRETDARTPAEELAGFHLPDGFVAELVASEPQISKPLNMAFDADGRLWITDTVEYPYPAPSGQVPRDTIKVLEDKDGDGSFETVTTFADQLNIPIGILPVREGVLCFSIPNLMLLKDTDGDGRCDQRQVILGPFDTTRDTHGMINALRRGADGWIYACHGFNNQSHVKAADGSEIHLTSGNTFRFREDGSRVEQFTNGQVNPFGMTSDEFGNWFTADCHSKPVTMLIQGGYYESFGRPHDGLGFVPAVMDHLHGSTAICGLSYYLADHYPEPFQRKFYSGNVMTSRINCNRWQVDRDRIQLVEEPDFMTSDDPWFRPVDIQLGPDGALYIADFYNKIIGHYEVRLDHPERDRTSGRIWRIVYRGADDSQPLSSNRVRGPAPLSKEHLEQLASANATTRHFAFEALAQAQLDSAQSTELNLLTHSTTPPQRSAAIWALHRHDLIHENVLAAALIDAQPETVVTIFKVWSELSSREAHRRAVAPPGARDSLYRAALSSLRSDVPQVSIAAAGALAHHGDSEAVRQLLQQISERPASGAIVPHAMRIAVKRLLKQTEIAKSTFTRLDQLELNQRVALASILPAVDSPLAAETLLSLVASSESFAAARGPALQLACKHMRPEFAEPVVQLLRGLGSSSPSQADLLSGTLDSQATLALEALATLRAAKQEVPPALTDLLNEKLLEIGQAIAAELKQAGNQTPLTWQASGPRAWGTEDRRRQDNAQKVKTISSLPLGENYTGTYATAPFACPDQLSFWLAGHDGPPNVPPGGKNVVRLVRVNDGQVLVSVAPPRHDALHLIQWSLKGHNGQPVRFECVDGDDGNAYAWLAVYGFSLPELNPPRAEGAIAKWGRLIEGIGPSSLATAESLLKQIVAAPALGSESRAHLAAAVNAARGFGLGKLLADVAVQRGQSAAVTAALVADDQATYNQACHELATQIAARLTLPQQTIMVRGLIGSSEGRSLLLQLVDQGRISNESLRSLHEVLSTNQSDSQTNRLIQLSHAASASSSPAEQAIIQRVAGFKLTDGNFEKGKLLYDKNCANCHKLRGTGQLVGPQLDGVGPRGPERLAEDILLPNRNVDKAFRMTSLLMDDDRVLVGLLREGENGQIQLVGTDGKLQAIDPTKIEMRKDTARSLMPDNFAELLNDQDLSDLLHYIMHH